jgi:Na+-translocating ferredoxin:NAD+ oxidoreductase RNF subunit RnfB
LGFSFAASRYFLTLPGIIFLGYVVNKIVCKKDLFINAQSDLDEIIKIEEILPGSNCGACGYKNCREYASAIYRKSEEKDLCEPGSSEVIEELKRVKL